MDDMSLTCTSNHGASVDKRTHVIDVIVIPVVWVIDVARVLLEVDRVVRFVWIIRIIDRRLVGCVKLIDRVVVKADKANVSRNR